MMSKDDKNAIKRGYGSHRALEMNEMPEAGRRMMLDNDLMISDNLDFSVPLSLFNINDTSTPVKLGIPFKLRFNITIICLQGSMHIRFNMKEYDIVKGTIFTSVEGMIGECVSISPDLRLIMFAYSKEFASAMYSLSMRTVFGGSVLTQPDVILPDKDLDDVVEIYKMLRRKLSDPEFACKRELAMSSLTTIYWYVSSLWINSDAILTKKVNRRQQIFEEFIRLVGTYCTSQRGLAFYADKLCITPKYLSQAVYEASGRTARQWICDRVVLEAKALLKGENLTVQQISEQLHFPNQSFFGVFFKKATGYSPKGYREEM